MAEDVEIVHLWDVSLAWKNLCKSVMHVLDYTMSFFSCIPSCVAAFAKNIQDLKKTYNYDHILVSIWWPTTESIAANRRPFHRLFQRLRGITLAH